MIVDDAFAYSVATDIMLSDDIEPRFVDEADVEPIGQTGNKQTRSNSIQVGFHEEA